MENKVTYPMLSDAEIVECFKELGVQQLTVQNLSKPEPEFIYALYENVVQKLMGITGEEMSKPVFEPYNQLEHPHLYDAAIYQITFIGNLFKVMRAAGVEFKLADLLAPTYQRTRRFMSAIINFAKYREEKFAKFEETDQEGERLEEEQLLAEDANQAAMAELGAVRAEIAAEEPVMREMTSKLGNVADEIEHWKKELAAAQAQQQLLERKLEEATKRSDKSAAQVTELAKTKAGLMKRVIPDPERELRTIEDLRLRQEKEEELLTSAQKTRSERLTRRDQLEKSRKAILKAVALCQDIADMLDHVKSERKHIKDFKTSIAANENILRELDVNAGRLQTQLDSTKDRTSQAQSEQDKVRLEKQKELEAIRGKKSVVEKEHAEVLAQIKELDLEIAKLETEEIAITRSHQERANLSKTSIHGLISQLRAYHKTLHASMRDTMQAQQEELARPVAQLGQE